MKPTADTEPFAPVFFATDNDFFNRVETSSWLDLKKDKLIPTGRNGLARDRPWLRNGIFVLGHGIEFQGTSPIPLPHLIVWKGHI